jgi:hypothetical protein
MGASHQLSLTPPFFIRTSPARGAIGGISPAGCRCELTAPCVIQVHVAGEGLALGHQTHTVSLALVSVTPDTAHVGGGLELRLEALGLGHDPAGVLVTVGGEAAQVTAVEGTAVTVVLPPAVDGAVGVVPGVLTVNGEQVGCRVDGRLKLRGAGVQKGI